MEFLQLKQETCEKVEESVREELKYLPLCKRLFLAEKVLPVPIYL